MNKREKGYRAPQVCAIVGITYRQLDYWARTDFMVPSLQRARGSGSQRLYSFADLVQLKVVKRLIDAGMDVKRIRKAFAELSRQGSSWNWDDGGVTLISDGASIYALKSPQEIIDIFKKGQAVMGVTLGPVVEEISGEVRELAKTAPIEEGYRSPGGQTEVI
ncbi:MAG: MerR family transcriptional regulator [bacterium]|nr:MerR family transcriptional regulator [Acidimicrobiia bacterium]MCY4649166.1 MerR family transcriptional regulator [bacterium]